MGIEKARSNKIFVKPQADSKVSLKCRRVVDRMRQKGNRLTRIYNSQVSEVGNIAKETKRAMKEEGVCL